MSRGTRFDTEVPIDGRFQSTGRMNSPVRPRIRSFLVPRAIGLAMVWGKKQESVGAQVRAAADRCPDRSRTRRHGGARCRHQLAYDSAGPPRAGDGDDESDRASELLHERGALQLCGAELSLKVHERALDLDVDRLGGSSEHEVCRAPISSTDRLFDGGVPRRVGLGHKRLDCVELTTIPEREAVRRVELDSELVAAGRRERAGGRPIRAPGCPLGPAHHRLTDTCEARQLVLGQANGRARQAQQ